MRFRGGFSHACRVVGVLLFALGRCRLLAAGTGAEGIRPWRGRADTPRELSGFHRQCRRPCALPGRQLGADRPIPVDPPRSGAVAQPVPAVRGGHSGARRRAGHARIQSCARGAARHGGQGVPGSPGRQRGANQDDLLWEGAADRGVRCAPLLAAEPPGPDSFEQRGCRPLLGLVATRFVGQTHC